MPSPQPEIRLAEDQKRLLRLLRGHSPRSRIELSRMLQINNGVMTRYCKELVSLGLIVESDAQRSGRGRPALPLHLREDGAYAIGAATHPGWIDLCVVDFAGKPIVQRSLAWDESDPGAFTALLQSEVAGLTAGLNLRRSRFLGYGVSVPGYARGSSSQRHTVERMRSWREQDLSQVLGAALGEQVWIENDANCAAIAEYYNADGQARIGASMLVLYLGHGVGGGCIIEGNLFIGEFANAGEIGILYPLDQPRPSAVDLLGELQRASGEEIALFRLADHLDAHRPTVDAWVRRAAEQLRIAIFSGIAWMDPSAVSISGTLPDRVLAAIADELGGFDWQSRLGERAVPAIRASCLEGTAAAIGAAFLPIHNTIAPARSEAAQGQQLFFCRLK